MVSLDVHIIFVSDDLKRRFVRWSNFHHLIDYLLQGNDWIAVKPINVVTVGR